MSAHYPAGNGTYFTVSDFRPDYETDAAGNKTSFTANKWGETVNTTDAVPSVGASASVTTSDYYGDTLGSDANCANAKPGQLCSMTLPNGGTTVYHYNGTGNTAGNVSSINALTPLGVKTFTYDAAGRVTSVLDGRGTTTYTCYDGDDRTVQSSTTSSNCAAQSGVTYTYDADGNLTQRHAAATSITTTTSYDKQNRPTGRSDSTTTLDTSTEEPGLFRTGGIAWIHAACCWWCHSASTSLGVR